MRLAVMHNLYFYNQLTARIREALDAGTFAEFRSRYSERLAQRADREPDEAREQQQDNEHRRELFHNLEEIVERIVLAPCEAVADKSGKEIPADDRGEERRERE